MIIESGVRLSRSKLWQLQRAYFERAGVDAWGSATVPHYITCNAFIAEAYAQVVLGWLKDCAPFDPSEPVYLVELGAGSGRFAYLFLKRLVELLSRSKLADIRLTYVMTDFTDRNLEFWRKHPSFRTLLQEGMIDFARFDAENQRALVLTESKKTLEKTKNPVAVLANYFFDSIPQDVFYVAEAKLYECLPVLTVPDDVTDLEDPEILKKIEVSYEDRPIEGAYYDDAELDGILTRYLSLVEDSAVKFPLMGLGCCRFFSELSQNRWLMLSGDKGYVHEDALGNQKRPGLAYHGAFSMNVNYHALGQFFLGRGGRVLSMDHHHASLNVVGFAMGAPSLETDNAFANYVETFGPDDYFLLRKGLDTREDLTLEQAMSLLRLSRFDTRLLRQLLPVLRKHGPKSSHTIKLELMAIVNRSLDLYFHIGEEHDILFSSGVLVFELGDYERAIDLFMKSIELYGVDAGSAYNLALAHHRRSRPSDALEWAKAALEAEPAHVAARKLKEELEAVISAGA